MRRAGLHDPAGVHDSETRRHRHGFFLVVGHDDEGEAELLLQAHQLEARALAQLAVEGGERLVEQQQFRLLDQRAGERHALALAARELRGIAGAQVLELDQGQRFGHARWISAAGRPSRRSP